MQTEKEIKKYVKQKKKQGYEGYKDMLEYFKNFDMQQLDYLEILFKTSKESSERLWSFREVVTIFIAMLALIISVFPEPLKENSEFLGLLVCSLLFCIILGLIMFLFINNYTSREIDICRTILEIIEKVKIIKSKQEAG